MTKEPSRLPESYFMLSLWCLSLKACHQRLHSKSSHVAAATFNIKLVRSSVVLL